MQDFSASPRELVASFWRNRALIYALSKREVAGRYRGSHLGILWSFINPLFMLIIYTFVFGVIFKARWSEQSDSKTEFALILFAGFLIFNLFSECVNKAPALILSNVSYVKKIVFPLEILPWVNLYSALLHGLISLLAWIMAYSLLFGAPQLTALYLPLIILPLCFMVMGLSWVLASLGVYLRDIGQFIGVFISASMFMSPIFFPLSALPEQFRFIFELNPLTPAIEMTRDVLIKGEIPNTQYFLVYFLSMLTIAYLGFAWFQLTRRGFADVI